MNRPDIYAAIAAARLAQAAKWNRPHAWGWGDCSSQAVDWTTKAAVLGEECGEVARAVLEADPTALRTELVQVAAVAVAWLEALA